MIKMAKTNEKVLINGKSVTSNEKRIYDLVKENGESISAVELLPKCSDLTINSVRSTLSRLEKIQGLLVKKTVLINDKAVSSYAIAPIEEEINES